MPEDDDGSSEAVPISIPFPFFDQNQNSLFDTSTLSVTSVFIRDFATTSRFNLSAGFKKFNPSSVTARLYGKISVFAVLSVPTDDSGLVVRRAMSRNFM
ncbi:hypothetical protein OS493_003732 [Desmophyllum pertusum]|uniref:Uncharacterized protein n=1 Tax=Desmophyllum pertusum TaxID=174260 RepID=A0A9X0A9K5_9CNID|nr:hypothetical protein OS493_003732 [Desmophyllum pertusum]